MLTSEQLHLTPREAERLRNVSYQRQLEAGMRNPGSAGITSDRLGDADKWMPDQRVATNGTIPMESRTSIENIAQETK
jgi:hypothetical protein